MWLLDFFTGKSINVENVDINKHYCRKCLEEGALTKVKYKNGYSDSYPACSRKDEHNETFYYRTDGELEDEIKHLSDENVIPWSDIIQKFNSDNELR